MQVYEIECIWFDLKMGNLLGDDECHLVLYVKLLAISAFGTSGTFEKFTMSLSTLTPWNMHTHTQVPLLYLIYDYLLLTKELHKMFSEMYCLILLFF